MTIYSFHPAEKTEINKILPHCGGRLPDDYAAFLTKQNGLLIKGETVCDYPCNIDQGFVGINMLYGVCPDYPEFDLLTNTCRYQNDMAHFPSICIIGEYNGNFFFIVPSHQATTVYYWDRMQSHKSQPDIVGSEDEKIYIVAPSFTEFHAVILSNCIGDQNSAVFSPAQVLSSDETYQLTHKARSVFVQPGVTNNLLTQLATDIYSESLQEYFSLAPSNDIYSITFRFQRLNKQIKFVMLKYAAGSSMKELHNEVQKLFDNFEALVSQLGISRTDYNYVTANLTQYLHFLWLFSLGYLFKIPNAIPILAKTMNYDDRNGPDLICHLLFNNAGVDKFSMAKATAYPEQFQLILEILQSKENDTQSFTKNMRQYINGWYQNILKSTPMDDAVTRPERYYGYCALEAALVTVMCDINDDEFRDLNFYPKDLVDYARLIKDEETFKIEEEKRGILEYGGNKAPKSGYWFCPNEEGEGSRSFVYFKEGEILPGGYTSKGLRVWYYTVQK